MGNSADDRLAAIDRKIASLKKERAELLPRTTIACLHCGDLQIVGDLVVLVWQTYKEPSGCSGGDYWSASATGFKCIACQRDSKWSEPHKGKSTSPLWGVLNVVAGRLELAQTWDRRGTEATLVGPWQPQARTAVLRDLALHGIRAIDKSTVKVGA